MEFDEARYAEIIGKRAPHYLPRFRRFAKGGWISWNWAAFFGTLAWLRYRRLYLWSWLYFFVSTPMLMLWGLVLASGDACQAALDPAGPLVLNAMRTLIAAGWILPPLVADRLYFNEVRRLARITADGDKPAPPARSAAIVSTLAVQVLVVLVLMTSLASYNDYGTRARVSEGVLLASGAREPLQEYVARNHRLPVRLEEVAETGPGGMVARLDMIERGTLRATFGERAGRLAGHTISFVPTWNDNQIVAWTCRSADLPDRCLPSSCRPRP